MANPKNPKDSLPKMAFSISGKVTAKSPDGKTILGMKPLGVSLSAGEYGVFKKGAIKGDTFDLKVYDDLVAPSEYVPGQYSSVIEVAKAQVHEDLLMASTLQMMGQASSPFHINKFGAQLTLEDLKKTKEMVEKNLLSSVGDVPQAFVVHKQFLEDVKKTNFLKEETAGVPHSALAELSSDEIKEIEKALNGPPSPMLDAGLTFAIQAKDYGTDTIHLENGDQIVKESSPSGNKVFLNGLLIQKGDFPDVDAANPDIWESGTLPWKKIKPLLTIPKEIVEKSVKWMQILHGTPIVNFDKATKIIYANVGVDLTKAFGNQPQSDLGSWGHLPIIAIGPKGGKIVGYDKWQKPIYAGSVKAHELVQHHAAMQEPGATYSTKMEDWLGTLGMVSSVDSPPGFVSTTPANAEHLKEAFGVQSQIGPSGHAEIPVADLIPHIGHALKPAAGKADAYAAKAAAGDIGEDQVFPDPSTLKPIPLGPGEAGSHGNLKFEGTDGKHFLFKPGNDRIALASEFAGRIGTLLLGEGMIQRARYANVANKDGALVEFLPGQTAGVDHNELPQEWAKKYAKQIIQHEIVDWLISNHDAHSGNFLADGDKLRAIDKGQAGKFIGQDKLEPTYKGTNGSNQIYQGFWQKFKSGSLGASISKEGIKEAASEVVEKAKEITPEQLAALLKPYIKVRTAQTGEDAGQLEQHFQDRFKNLKGDVEAFLKKQGVTGELPIPKTANFPPPAPPAFKPAVVVTSPDLTPTKPLAVPGWPKTKGSITIHHPGSVPPPHMTWPVGYPGPGFKTSVDYKGGVFHAEFKQVGGKIGVEVTYPDGSKSTWDSPNQAANSLSYFHQKLPLDGSVAPAGGKKVAFNAKVLLGIAKFEDELKQAATSHPAAHVGAATPDQLVEAKIITPEATTLSVHQMAVALPDGIVQDHSALPPAVKIAADQAKANGFTIPGELLPGTVFKTSIAGGGVPFYGVAVHGPLGAVKYKKFAVTSAGDVSSPQIISGSLQESGSQSFKKIADHPSFAAHLAEAQAAAPPLPPAPKAIPIVQAEPTYKPVAPPLPPLSKPLPETPAGPKLPQKTKLGKTEIHWPENIPANFNGPLPPGTKIHTSKGALSDVQMHVLPDGQFQVLVDGKSEGVFKSPTSAADHVWVMLQGHENVAAYSKATGVSKPPSGGGWKFWGINPSAPPTIPAKVTSPNPSPSAVTSEGAIGPTEAMQPKEQVTTPAGTSPAHPVNPAGFKPLSADQAQGHHAPGTKIQWVGSTGTGYVAEKLPAGTWKVKYDTSIGLPGINGNAWESTHAPNYINAIISSGGAKNLAIQTPETAPIAPQQEFLPKINVSVNNVFAGAMLKNAPVGMKFGIEDPNSPGHVSTMTKVGDGQWSVKSALGAALTLDEDTVSYSHVLHGALENGTVQVLEKPSPAAVASPTLTATPTPPQELKAEANETSAPKTYVHPPGETMPTHVLDALPVGTKIGQSKTGIYTKQGDGKWQSSTSGAHWSAQGMAADHTLDPYSLVSKPEGSFFHPSAPNVVNPSLLPVNGQMKWAWNGHDFLVSKLPTGEFSYTKDGNYVGVVAPSTLVGLTAFKVPNSNGTITTTHPTAFAAGKTAGATSLKSQIHTTHEIPGLVSTSHQGVIKTIQGLASAPPDPVLGKNPYEKPAFWEPWIPPAGVVVQGEHEGVPYFFSQIGPGYQPNPSGGHVLSDKPHFFVFHANDSKALGVANTLDEAVSAATTGLVTDAEKIFPGHKENIFAAGEHLGNLPTLPIVNKAPEDIKPEEQSQLTKKTMTLHEALGVHNLAKQFGSKFKIKDSSPGYKVICLDGNPEVTKAHLQNLMTEFGLKNSFGPNGGTVPQTGHFGAFIKIPSADLQKETTHSVSVSDASSIVPQVPSAIVPAQYKTLPKKFFSTTPIEDLKSKIAGLPVGTELKATGASVSLVHEKEGWVKYTTNHAGEKTKAVTYQPGPHSHETVANLLVGKPVSVIPPGVPASALPSVPKPLTYTPPTPKAQTPEQAAAVEHAKKVQEWAKDTKSVTDPEQSKLLAYLSQDHFGGKNFYAKEKDGELLLGDGTPEFQKKLEGKGVFGGVVDTPLGPMVKVSPEHLKSLYAHHFETIQGPDGNTYPKGTTFTATHQNTTIKALIGELGSAKLAPHKFDANKQVIKVPGNGPEQAKAIKDWAAKYGVTLGEIKSGPSYTNGEIPNPSQLEQVAKTQTSYNPVVPPGPAPFFAKALPVAGGTNYVPGQVAQNNRADFAGLKEIAHGQYGTPYRFGAGAIFRGGMVNVRRVKEVDGQTYYEVAGVLTNFDPSKGIGLTPSSSDGEFKVANYDKQTGTHTETHEKVKSAPTFDTHKGTTVGGARISIGDASEPFQKDHFRIRVPEGADVEKELHEAFHKMGQNADAAMAHPTAADDQLIFKGAVAKAMFGTKGWDTVKGKVYHDEKKLDALIASNPHAKHLLENAHFRYDYGGGIHVVSDDPESVSKAHFVFVGVSTGRASLNVTGGGAIANNSSWLAGITKHGGSPGSDSASGGTQGTFFRMAFKHDPEQDRHWGSFNDDGKESIIFHPRILNRVDWWGGVGDSYGGAGMAHAYSNGTTDRWNFADYKLHANHEVMFEKGASNKDMAGILCRSPARRLEVIKAMKDQGFADGVNGIPLEQFVVHFTPPTGKQGVDREFLAKNLHGLQPGVLP